MRIVEPKVEIITPINGEEILKHIEKVGRVCYKSESNIDNGSAEKFVSGIIKRGHTAVIEHYNITVKFTTDRGCCYDDETKVLTKNGWKYFDEVDIENDYFATLDDLNKVVYIKANKLIKKEYNGKMHNWVNSRIDCMVTPNHNMWLYDYEKRPKNRVWDFIKSEDANNSRYEFLRGSDGIYNKGYNTYEIQGVNLNKGFYTKEYKSLKLNANLFFELIGWWITDGSLSKGENGSGNRVSITQIKKEGRKRIINILESLGFSFSVYSDHIRINSPQLYKFLFDNFIKNDDFNKSLYVSIPRWMFEELSSENLTHFIKGVIGGDGSKFSGGNGYQIYTSSYNFAMDLIEMAMMVGKSGSIRTIEETDRKFPDRDTISKCKEQYVVSLVDSKTSMWNKNSSNNAKNEVDYQGFVYCVELPIHHKLYVMRNGKACWCGNSHEIVRHRIASYAQESTRYCNYSKEKFGDEISVVKPVDIKEGTKEYEEWIRAMMCAETFYMSLINTGCKAQTARSVLPTCAKTEIMVTMNLREWRHFIKLRSSKAAHPDIRVLAIDLLNQFKEKIPVIFDDIEVE